MFPLLAWEFDEYESSARRVHDDVARVLDEERAPLIDLLGAWHEIGAKNLRSLELKGGDPLHPNPRGHEDVARRVYAHLVGGDWLDLGPPRPPKLSSRAPGPRLRPGSSLPAPPGLARS